MTRRLLASFLAVIAFMLVVLGVPFWRSILVSEHDSLRTLLERDAVVLATLVEDTLSEPASSSLQERRADSLRVALLYSEKTGARVVVVDADGLTLADNESRTEAARSFRTRPEIEQALAGRVGVDQRYSHTLGRSALFVATPVSSSGKVLGAVRLSYTTAEMDRRIRIRALRMFSVGAVAVVAAMLLAFALARSLNRPIHQLSAATKLFGEGSLQTRVATGSGAPELRALSTDFNSMASRIEELVEAQTLFVADASHQMRSPLTAARLRVEALAYSSPDRLPGEVDAAVEEMSRLSRVIDGLLELARADSSSPHHQADISETVRDRVETWSALGNERNISISCSAPSRVVARVDVDRVTQILDNLISNALDASTAGDEVRLSVTGGPEGAVILVDDEGIGMTETQRQRAFDRLWRANNRRTELSGSGLGLPIARKLAEADGGSLTLLVGLRGRGTTARLRYPVVTVDR